MGARCNCWLGEPGATCGSSEVRMRCPVHGDPVTPVTPPTPDLTALEQWARNWWCRIFSQEIADAILALCETVRAQGCDLAEAKGRHEADVITIQRVMRERKDAVAERDAAVARAEQAERERDALMVQVDQWRRMADREVTACVEMRAERDAARAEVAQLQQKLHEAEERAIGDDATFKRLISERTVADQQRDAALSERWKLNAEVAQARAERDEWQARATRAEIAQVEARMQDISERQAESVLQAIEDRGLVTWATERDILIRRAEQAEATIATLRADLQAAQALPPLPEGWAYYAREDAWARTRHPERPGQRYASVSLNDEGVVIEGDINPIDLITVLRHAQAARARLREQAHPTHAQEGR